VFYTNYSGDHTKKDALDEARDTCGREEMQASSGREGKGREGKGREGKKVV
jgi:hypothetical protein